MPVGQVVATDTEAAIHEAIQGARSIGEVINVVERVMELGSGEAEIAGAAAADEVGSAAVTAVADNVFDPVVLAVLLAVIAVLVILRFLENALAGLFGIIPWVGGKISNGIHLIFSPLDKLEDALVSAFVGVLRGLILAWCTMIIDIVQGRWPWLNQGPGQPVYTGNLLQPLQYRIDQLSGEVQQLRTSVQQLEHVVYGRPASPGVPTVDYGTQLGTITNQLAALQTYVGQIHGQTSANTRDINTLKSEVATLIQEFRGVRATEVGWADFQQEVAILLDSIQNIQARQGATQVVQAQQIHSVLPLAVLTHLGAPGIDNLVRLEEDPCQCPRIPELPLDVGAVLAAWLAMDYGL